MHKINADTYAALMIVFATEADLQRNAPRIEREIQQTERRLQRSTCPRLKYSLTV